MDTRQPLAGQVSVVTGAGRGIGSAIARKLAALGATAVLLGRTKSTLDETARAIVDAGGKTEVIPCDVTVLHQLEYAAARVDSTFGRLDILVNNAGVGGFNDPLLDLPPEQLLRSWRLIAEGHPTIAGMLLFGRNPQEHLPFAQVNAARIPGIELANDPSLTTQTIQGSLPATKPGRKCRSKKHAVRGRRCHKKRR